MIDHERLILGHLIMRPELLRSSDDLVSGFFGNKKNREVFIAINEIFEDSRPEIIDARILADRLGGDGAVTYVGGLIDGLQHITPGGFLGLVREAKKQKLGLKIFRRYEQEARALKATGNFDPSRIRPLYDEYDQLCQPEGAAVLSLNTVEAKAINWLWPRRLPLGMISLLGGDPGQGKSLLSIYLAALLSRGLPFPDSTEPPQASDSLFIIGEDPIAQAVRPRADANGADTSRLLVFEDNFNLINLNPLRRALKKYPGVRLVVIDPLSAFFPPRTRYLEDPSVRQALLPVVSLAEEKNVAVLLIVHLRKAEAENILHKIGGTIGLPALARSILAIAPDEEDSERRLLFPLKSNYSRKAAPLAFRIQNDLSIGFESGPVQMNADDVFSSEETKDRKDERSFNLNWLRDYLGGGPKTVQETERAAHEVGISRATLYRLSNKLGVLSRTQGEGRFKTWSLPHA